MSVGLLALLDDVAALVKLTAASLDDVAGQAAKAGTKAAGAAVDDAAVTPRYMEGLPAARELPIVWRIAVGSIRNKLLFLLPAALLLSFFAPWAITPLLMLGGLYLCYEGAEKIYAALFPHGAAHHEQKVGSMSPKKLEDQKVSGAIKTDFILSAEIMTIALSALPTGNVWMQGLALAMVAIGITVAIYGSVAIIVRLDDLGLLLGRNTAQTGWGRFSRALGKGVVRAVPILMEGLAMLGTAAMLWVGGGILLHGLHELGFAAPDEWLVHLEDLVHAAAPVLPGVFAWATMALGSAVVGLAVGALAIPIVSSVIAPVWNAMSGMLPGRQGGH